MNEHSPRLILLRIQSMMPNATLAEVADLIDEPVGLLMRIDRGVSDMPDHVEAKILDALEDAWTRELAEADIPDLDI